MTRVLVVDNYDSFVYTLNGYLQQLGATTEVIRNDQITADEIAATVVGFDAILISPGPGTPAAAGISPELIRYAIDHQIPLLGVCLGHQAIAEVCGGVVGRAPELMHGKTSELTHDDSLLFTGVNSPFTATRYHSLAIEEGSLPAELRATAHTDSGIIMGLEHRTAPVFGVQFHPESILTEGGHRMLANWLAVAGLTTAPAAAENLSPLLASDPR